MVDLKLYTISDEYIAYLKSHVDKHVFANKDDSYVHSRKYLGAVLEINDYKYYIPLSSPKDSDYTEDSKGNKIVRKSIIPIIRMIDVDENGIKTLLGTLKLSNMIPASIDLLTLYDIDNEPDAKYKDLVEKEIRYINRHTTEIVRNASVLYKQKTNNEEIGYLKSTLDFKKLEEAHKQFSKGLTEEKAE